MCMHAMWSAVVSQSHFWSVLSQDPGRGTSVTEYDTVRYVISHIIYVLFVMRPYNIICQGRQGKHCPAAMWRPYKKVTTSRRAGSREGKLWGVGRALVKATIPLMNAMSPVDYSKPTSSLSSWVIQFIFWKWIILKKILPVQLQSAPLSLRPTYPGPH